MPRYVYRPSALGLIFRWSAVVAALYLALFALAYVAGHVLPVAGPYLAVAGLGYGAVALVRRSRDR